MGKSVMIYNGSYNRKRHKSRPFPEVDPYGMTNTTEPQNKEINLNATLDCDNIYSKL